MLDMSDEVTYAPIKILQCLCLGVGWGFGVRHDLQYVLNILQKTARLFL